jgi:hypothetical protein
MPAARIILNKLDWAKNFTLVFIFFLFLFLFIPNSALAAASLTVSSASLAADGKTVTVNIGGVSGSLSPASDITGFTVKVGSVAYPSTAVTSSGSVVTLTTSAFISSTSTVTIDLSASPTSNLTDGGSNTPQGQTGQAVTNGSAISFTPFNATDSAILFSGVSPTISTSFSLGSRNGQLEVLITGTCANFAMNNSAGNAFTVTVDGSSSTVTSVGSQQKWSLFCGLSDAAHRVTITGSGSLVTENFFQVVGSAPTISRVTDIGNVYNIVDTSTRSALQVSSGWEYHESYTCYKTAWPDEKIKFNTAATKIDAWIYNRSDYIYVEQDGVVIATTTPSGASTWGYVTLASGLDGQSHEYTIGSGGYNSTFSYIYSIVLTGGTLGTAPSAPTSFVGGYGDSITAADQITTSDQGFLYNLNKRLGSAPINRGIGGTRVIGSGDTRTVDITNATSVPAYVTVLYGVNDVGTSADFLTSFTNMMTSLVTGLSSTKFFVMGLLQNGYDVQRNTDIRSAITTVNNSNIRYIDTSGWTLPDMNGNHPGPIGYTNMTNYLVPYMSTTAYTVSGPTNGLPNVASSNFTVTLANSGAFDSTTTISIAVPDGTITAVAAGGTITNNGTSSVTVGPAKDSSSFTFTYLPSVEGTKTLTFTNGQGWTNPSSATYYVSEPTVSSYFPTDGAAGVTTTANLVLTFNGAVDVETGNITIYKVSDDSVFEQIPVTADNITGSGTASITINATSTFDYETEYYIKIDATAFDDANGNSFAGISNATTWNFTTEAAPASSTTIVGGSAPAPAPAVGVGANTNSIGMGQTGSIGNITSQGTNILTYINSQADFTTMVSNSHSGQSHNLQISDLDLLNNIVTITFNSKPTVVKLALGQTKPVDLDQDGINDIQATFTNLVVNRVEITIQSLLASSDYEGKLIKYANSPKVYLIQENKKRWIISAKAFVYHNYQWDKIITIGDGVTSFDGLDITTATKKSGYTFTKFMALGSTGEGVRQLQQKLKELGYFTHPTITSYFGPATQQAVIRLQKAYNLKPQAGFVGPMTRKVLNEH